MCGTSLAGFLGIGVHWVASRAGEQMEPIIIGVSLFLLGIFINKIKFHVHTYTINTHT